MSLEECSKVITKNPQIALKVYKGHFATSHSHINYFIDVTPQKTKIDKAQAVADELSVSYKGTAVVDTVLCLDGTEIIGAFLAKNLAADEYTNLNAGKHIAVLTPEYTMGSQLFFRDNVVKLIADRHVLILAGSVVTGFTAKSAADAINYYGGKVCGIASIFATEKEYMGIPIVSVFDPESLPGYTSYTPYECPFCKAGWKVEALVNSHGLSKL